MISEECGTKAWPYFLAVEHTAMAFGYILHELKSPALSQLAMTAEQVRTLKDEKTRAALLTDIKLAVDSIEQGNWPDASEKTESVITGLRELTMNFITSCECPRWKIGENKHEASAI